MAAIWAVVLFACVGLCTAWMDERPVLGSQDGNLFISSAKDRNITLKILGKGYLNVNDINLLHIATAAQNAARFIERWKTGTVGDVEENLSRLTALIEGPSGLQKRVTMLELGIDSNITTQRPYTNAPGSGDSGVPKQGIRRLTDRIQRLEEKVRGIVTKLRQNECESNPCMNGGTCVDLYESYQCYCPSNWEGSSCNIDVNECARFLGTDLGCQNGATCVNTIGSFQCNCAPGWYGLHCTKKTSVCNTQNSEELCGHGVCLTKPGSLLGYICICDQGWETDGTNPACIKDVDECAAKHPPCSVNPAVPCINVPGTFYCGGCPHGYTGNGYYCADIDECIADNGGCSTEPRVQCINTMGSRICGSCPSGYQGDGVSCTYVGACHINNGGCHSLATCTQSAGMSSTYVICRCPPGYFGDGYGPQGCQQGSSELSTACASNPCVHGVCRPHGLHGFTCMCDQGYTGMTCAERVDLCAPNPCRNGGTCVVRNGQPVCICPSAYNGPRCATARQSCGGVLQNPVGHFQFPGTGTTYQHGLSCAWVILTNHTQVINITFTSFNVEQSVDCKYDFLQIHDGRNPGSHAIGRFCGTELPNKGNIVSSHNALYFWFNSDNSIAHDGFAFDWNSIDPVCGGELSENFGTIVSPGYPGRYPPNRDCYWYISVPPSKRVQFHFGQLMLEESTACEHDYVEISEYENKAVGRYCNHSRPDPLMLPGHTAIVHFHSDGSTQDSGFQIHYTAVEGIPGCGGIYTTKRGIITSPGDGTSYLPMIECEWKIQTPVGERVRISWLNFDLEDSHSCQFDYVQIFDGPSTDSPSFGKYCGTTLPPTIRSTSNVVVIQFTTDWSIESPGFRLKYEQLCGGEFRDETGIVTSPNYPNDYPKEASCVYEIIQPIGKGIVLTMMDMQIENSIHTECWYDSLSIYDGDNENSTRLAELCGSINRMPREPFQSTHNYMYLLFTSDSSVNYKGWKANYTTVDRRCGGLLKAPNGIIEPPKENGLYSNNEDCTWIIRAPPGNVIELSWSHFHLEVHPRCRTDYVSIYEGYTTDDPDRLLGKFCGTNSPPTLTSQEDTLTVVFHTDSSVIYGGFTAIYSFIDASHMCGGHYFAQTGRLTSPNYPEAYPNNRECEWVIEAPKNQKVTLLINDFNLENNTRCYFDFLEIRNGGYETSPLIGKYCGTNIPEVITSFTHQLYIKFESDSTSRSTGFEINWYNSVQGCGGTLSSSSGDIMSPNYPQTHTENAECVWTLAVGAGNLIRISVIDIDLEEHSKCRYDYIEIFEGSGRNSHTNNRYCGSTSPGIIDVNSNIATVLFRSDFTGNGRGFHIRYDTLCRNKVRGFGGAIESPNFPNNYQNSANCSWVIEVPIGNKINLIFSHFELETDRDSHCETDYLEIQEGSYDEPNTNLGKFCGKQEQPRRINSTENQVFLTFVTDSYLAYGGFRLEWTINGCGGRLTKPTGTFTSPGFPNAYPENVDCEWLIEAEPSNSIEVTVNEINTERVSNCQHDKLELYAGSDDNAPLLTELCYSDKPVVYTSPGNSMFVKFHSDSTITARGFSVTYKSVPLQCGGKYTANKGLIHSTNYPKNYPNLQNCEWLLEVDELHVIKLTFSDFDIEASWNCTDDHVKIFDGPTRDYPLLGVHCRNQLPPSYVSTGHQMLVVMRTDSMVSAKGFKASYEKACGARIVVKDQGYISTATDFYTHKDLNCTWILTTEDPADHVVVTITHLDIKYKYGNFCRSQFVEVIEGEPDQGVSLGQWCENKVPPAITSTGNTLTLRLYSQEHYLHGSFAATFSLLNSACGGNYTSEHGTIATPGYPNSYPLGVECVWILNTAPGNRISLTFSEFDLQGSNDCNLDYVEVREESGIGKLLGIFCGKDVDSVTSSKKLWIKFRSDDSGTAGGFMADYSFLHGNELQGPTGEIASPLYPAFCRIPGEFSWRVSVDFGWVIRVEFKEFYIHGAFSECTSYVKIYDGYNSNGQELTSELCGFTKPPPVQSRSNMIYIEMISRYPLRVGNYFYLSWLQVPKDTDDGQQSVELSKCNEEIPMTGNTATYTFTSPGAPQGYENNLNCNWIFTSPPGTHLSIRFLWMDLEQTSDCMTDSVSVYSGNARTSTDNAVLLKKLCLSNSTYTPITASNVMTVKFETDGSVNMTGFRAVVYRECGGELSDPNGAIEINNSSAARTIRNWRFSCEWVINVRPGRLIEVEIHNMSIHKQNDGGCAENYLLIRNGGENDSPFLGAGKYCGENSPVEKLTTTANHLYVKAAGTKDSVNFKLTYKEVGMECGGNYILSASMPTMDIETPNYPNVPPPYSECLWSIMAPAGERISIHFIERFDLATSVDCEKEYVELRDGGTDISSLLGRFCSDTAPSSIMTTGNMLYIHYYSEMKEPKNGFNAVVHSGYSCSGILRSSTGVIRSPNYPKTYPNNILCGWAIIAPEGHSLKLQFQDLNLPGFRSCDSTDHLVISEKNEENGTLTDVATFCGNMGRFERTSPIIEVASNEAVVTFQTDDRNTIAYRGFVLNYTASREACGGELTAPSGIIKSPGYPNPKLKNRYCDWRITLTEGTQVVVDVLDIDLGSNDDGGRVRDTLSFYNDFSYKSRIVSLNEGGTLPTEIKSTSNTMRIVYWSRRAHRGFKLRYHAWAPAPCGARLLDTEGIIQGPNVTRFNQSSFYCNWLVQAPAELTSTANNTGVTLTVTVTGFISNYNPRGRHCYRYSYLTMGEIGDLCGVLTKPGYLRSPKPVNKFSMLMTPLGGQMNVNISYRWQQCGGVLNGPSHTITAPKGLSYPISCAWEITYSDSAEVITLNFKRINLGSCDKNYIIVRKGGPFSPQVGTYCGNIIPPNITSTTNRLWVEYFATAEPNDFEIDIQLGSAGCGLPMRGGRREILSPNFPRQYPNNTECIWEITARNGYHVGLTFVDRFNLESSTNCEKDFIQVFDWQASRNESQDEWKDLGKFCGRNSPAAINSTTNRMKVLFRTNEAIQADGFHAMWWQNCGGVFEVTKTPQFLTSPGYPYFYDRDLYCNYTFIAPQEDISIEFLDFSLEDGRDCMYDSVTFHTRDTWDNEETLVVCKEKPPAQRSISRIEMIFKTDAYIQRTGFQLRYFITDCGGIVTEPRTLEPLMNGHEYYRNINCTWLIKAPPGKSVTLRFEKFVTEYSSRCYFDSLDVYEGDRIDSDKILGHICGNLTARLPVFKSEGSNMVVNFETDSSGNNEGFIAKVLFGTSPSAGCGGRIELNPGDTKNFRTQTTAKYEPFEDCHWLVQAEEGQVVKFTFTAMDLKHNRNVTSNECKGDYLELHDGAGPYAESLGKFCGDTTPGPIVSSNNVMWIRLYTDGTEEGTGVTARITSTPSLCGPSVLCMNDTKQILTSPGYPQGYPSGTRCRWSLTHKPGTSLDRVHVNFVDFSMLDSKNCEVEGLEIIDKENHEYIGEGFGQDFVYSGTRKEQITVEMGSFMPFSVYRYCGSAIPHEYYSNPFSTGVELVFKGTNGGNRGFKLEYSTVSCDRNYTSEQGRIVHQDFNSCWITVTAPPGHTISMYFNVLRLYSAEECTDAGMQVREGDFNGRLIATLCGTDVPSPIFSTGNKLSLHSWSERSYTYAQYDITYTTTNKGRGCGGRIFNYGGRFTSPMYPNNYRNNTECTWDVIVPKSYKIVLEFKVFDLGATPCTDDYVRISDVMEDGTQMVRSTFCPESTPARIEGNTNRVNVFYKSSVNNGGSGWVVVFMGRPTTHPVEVVDDW